jgi:hypothetical protein
VNLAGIKRSLRLTILSAHIAVSREGVLGEDEMGIVWNIVRVGIAAVIIVAVAELSKRFPRYGALLLSLPIVSIIAFVMSWVQYHDLPAISKLAKETIVLVLLGLPCFIPLVFANRLGLGFWSSMALGIALACVTIGAWMWFAPTGESAA